MPEDQYRPRTLPQVVADAATAYGERVAITDGDVQLTYSELDAARVQAARAFIAGFFSPIPATHSCKIHP